MEAITKWQVDNNTRALPKELVATADVVHELQRQNAIPQFLKVRYIEGTKILKVE